MVFNKDIERLMNEMNQNMEKLTREFWNKSEEIGMEFSTQPSMDVINKGEKIEVKMDKPGHVGSLSGKERRKRRKRGRLLSKRKEIHRLQKITKLA